MQTEPVDLSKLPVLIVDNNFTNQRILEETLIHWNMEPTVVDNGAEALRTMSLAARAGRPFRLVLLDVGMPEMDGFMVAERIKDSLELTGATIMMLSSNNQRDDAARCRQLDVASYLIKPVTQSNLLDSIMTALGVRSITAASPTAASPQTAATPGLMEPIAKSLRILLVEDNAVNQRLAQLLLEKQGHSVVLAGNGKQALTALELDDFDVVLMDVQMPEMDGFEATEIIRKHETLSGVHIPIIAMTAHALKGDRERCLRSGMDDYVSKPINPNELIRVLNKLNVSSPSYLA